MPPGTVPHTSLSALTRRISKPCVALRNKIEMGEKMIIHDQASFSKTLTETDVYLFAGITGDFNPIHIDQVAAKASYAHSRIVHGALVSSMISTVIGLHLPGPGTVYMQQDSKFLKPVYIGDTVTAVVEVIEILNRTKGIINLRTYVKNQNNELVLDGHAVVKAPEI